MGKGEKGRNQRGISEKTQAGLKMEEREPLEAGKARKQALPWSLQKELMNLDFSCRILVSDSKLWNHITE